jgi:uncharacterized protein YxjI
MYFGDSYIGSIHREFSLFSPKYSIDCKNWQIDGDFMEWDYEIHNQTELVATVSKELFQWTDTYVIDVHNPQDALYALMLVLAIDAEKCSRKD